MPPHPWQQAGRDGMRLYPSVRTLRNGLVTTLKGGKSIHSLVKTAKLQKLRNAKQAFPWGFVLFSLFEPHRISARRTKPPPSGRIDALSTITNFTAITWTETGNDFPQAHPSCNRK